MYMHLLNIQKKNYISQADAFILKPNRYYYIYAISRKVICTCYSGSGKVEPGSSRLCAGTRTWIIHGFVPYKYPGLFTQAMQLHSFFICFFQTLDLKVNGLKIIDAPVHLQTAFIKRNNNCGTVSRLHVA